MAVGVTATAQRSRGSGKSAMYISKDYIHLSSMNAPVEPVQFEKHLAAIRAKHGKDGVVAVQARDEAGNKVFDEAGQPVQARDEKGRPQYEPAFVQSFNIVQSNADLDPDDPASGPEAARRLEALIEKKAPGHPALVAVEVNGRSGFVHAHGVVGARHPETGKQLRTVDFERAQLAIDNDEVLADLGVEQREDLLQMSRAAKEEMQRRKEEVLAEQQRLLDAGQEGYTPNQLKRRIEGAQRTVRLNEEARQRTPQQKKDLQEQTLQDRLQREFERYMLNEQTRNAAEDLDAPGPPERFSEIVLKSRVEEVLEDKRAVSWDELSRIGDKSGVTITCRGKDVSYGMKLHDEHGLVHEPARAHKRRGSRLGEGFRVEDVERALERNRPPQPIGGLGGVDPQPLSGLGAEHQQAMDRIGQDFQRELLEEHGDLLESKSVEPVAEAPVAETPAVEEPAAEEPSAQQEAAECVERDAEQLHQRLAERELEEKQWFDELMAKAPAQPETPEVETPEVSEAKAEEPQQIEHEAEEPQGPESKWSKLKERDAEGTAPEPVEQQREAEKPEPAKRREPGQEKSVGLLAEDQMQDREVIAVATERGDGTAYVDYQLAHHDSVAEGKKGLHLIAEHGKAKQVTLDEKQYQKLQEAAGANRTEVDGDRVFAVRGDLVMMQGDKPTALPSSVKPSEHQIGPDVLQKQQAAEDAVREQAREAYERKGQQMELKLPEREKEKDPKERPDITD